MNLSQPVWHTDPGSAALHPTHWQASLLGPHLTTTTCYAALHVDRPVTHRALIHSSERVVWLHITMVKVAGANWSRSTTVAYSHLEWPRSCFLDIFSAFNVLPPTSAQCDAGAQFTLPASQTSTDFASDAEFWTWRRAAPHGTFPWHFPFTLCTSDFRFTSVFLFILCFLSCGMHRPEQWGKQSSLLAAQHPAEKGAGFDFTWSHWHVTLHSEAVKLMQLSKNLYVTTDKMSNNDGTHLRAFLQNTFNVTCHFVIVTYAVFTKHMMLQYCNNVM